MAAFSVALSWGFRQPVQVQEAAHALSQGKSHFFGHAKFQTLATESQWSDEALADTIFLNVLEEIDWGLSFHRPLMG